MKRIPNTTAIILAGGRSSRMGQDKGMMFVEGKRMIEYTIDTVSKLTDKIIVIANNPEYEKLGYPIYADVIRDKGPLAGIVTGLSASTTKKNWIISCDTPYVTVDLLCELMVCLTDFDAVIPVFNERKNPLIATYNKAAIAPLQKALELDHLKLTEATKSLHVHFFDANQFDLINFKNLNSMADL